MAVSRRQVGRVASLGGEAVRLCKPAQLRSTSARCLSGALLVPIVGQVHSQDSAMGPPDPDWTRWVCGTSALNILSRCKPWVTF